MIALDNLDAHFVHRFKVGVVWYGIAQEELHSLEGIFPSGPIRQLLIAKPALEGAGVRLRRAFGFGNTSEVDPFLLLDGFRDDVPGDYLTGFPSHPCRGIETITYVLASTVEHGDSMKL
ncbi:pirin family protein [Edaphobacter sp. HDX4]|uniref:pirin family protein n=1 Tax=Edaphobacter sp. HDX4 TaxID=2794064 RepID=UPI002FE55CA6